MMFMRKNLAQQFQNEANNMSDSASKSVKNSKPLQNSEHKMTLSAMMIQSQNSLNDNICFDQNNNNVFDTQTKINYMGDDIEFQRQQPHFVNTEQKRNFERNLELEENIHREANQTRYQSLFKRFLQRERFDTTQSSQFQNSIFKSQSKDMEINKIKEFLIASSKQENNLSTLRNQNGVFINEDQIIENLTLEDKLTKISEKIEKEFEKDLYTLQKSNKIIQQQSQINSSQSVSPSLHSKSQKSSNKRFNDFNSQLNSLKHSPKGSIQESQQESEDFHIHSNFSRGAAQNDTNQCDIDNEYYSSVMKTDIDQFTSHDVSLKQQNNLFNGAKEINKKRSQSLFNSNKNEDRIFNEILGRNSQYIAEYEQSRVQKNIKNSINQINDKVLQEDTSFLNRDTTFLNKNTTNLEFSITKNNDTGFLTKRNSRPNSNRLLQKSDLQVFDEILESKQTLQNKDNLPMQNIQPFQNSFLNQNEIQNENMAPSQITSSIKNSATMQNTTSNKNGTQIENTTPVIIYKEGQHIIGQQFKNSQLPQTNNIYSNTGIGSEKLTGRSTPDQSMCKRKNSKSSCISSVLTRDNTNCMVSRQLSPENHHVEYKDSHSVSQMSSQYEEKNSSYQNTSKSEFNNLKQILLRDLNYNKQMSQSYDFKQDFKTNYQIQNQETTISNASSLNEEFNKKQQKEFDQFDDYEQETIKANSTILEVGQEDEEDTLEKINKIEYLQSRQSQNSHTESVQQQNKMNIIQKNKISDSFNQITMQQKQRSISHQEYFESTDEIDYDYEMIKVQNGETDLVYPSNLQDSIKETRLKKAQNSDYESSCNDYSVNSQIPKSQKQNYSFANSNNQNNCKQTREKPFLTLEADEDEEYFENNKDYFQNYNQNKKNHSILQQNDKNKNIQSQSQKINKQIQNKQQENTENQQKNQKKNHYISNQNICNPQNQKNHQNEGNKENNVSYTYSKEEQQLYYPQVRSSSLNQIGANYKNINDQKPQQQNYLNSNQIMQKSIDNQTVNQTNKLLNNCLQQKEKTENVSQFSDKRNYPAVRLNWNNISSSKKENEKNNQSFNKTPQKLQFNEEQQRSCLQNILKEKMSMRLDYYQNGQLKKMISEKESEVLQNIKQNDLQSAIRVLEECEKEYLKDIPLYDPHKVQDISFTNINKIQFTYLFICKLNLLKLILQKQFLQFNKYQSAYIILKDLQMSKEFVQPFMLLTRISSTELIIKKFYNQILFLENLESYLSQFEDPKMFQYCFKILNYYTTVLIDDESKIEKCSIILQKMIEIFSQNNSNNLELEAVRLQIQSLEEVGIVMKLVQCFMKLKQYKQAIKYLNDLLPILKNHNNPNQHFNNLEKYQKLSKQYNRILLAYKRKAQCYCLLNENSEAQKTLEESIKFTESNFKIHSKDDFLLVSELYEELARIQFKQTNYVESVSNFQFAIRIQKNLDDKNNLDKIAILLAEQAKSLVKLSEFQSAQQNFLDAYNIVTKTKGKYTQNATDCLLSVAKIYSKQKKFDKSIEVFEMILNMYQKMKVKDFDIKYLQIILSILEQCLESQNNEKYQQYETILRQIIDTHIQNDNAFQISNEVGNLLRKFNQYEGAIYYYSKTINEIYPQLKMTDKTKTQVILVMQNLASTYSTIQKYLQSLQIYEQALHESNRYHGRESMQSSKIQEQICSLRKIIQQEIDLKTQQMYQANNCN